MSLNNIRYTKFLRMRLDWVVGNKEGNDKEGNVLIDSDKAR